MAGEIKLLRVIPGYIRCNEIKNKARKTKPYRITFGRIH
jgi:hypothetical protein